jgi:hypothetical protein
MIMLAPSRGPTLALAGKTAHVRQYVLDRIESGEWRVGVALPGARDLAATLGISFVKVQQALETLALDGVIEIRPRIGAFVRRGWRDCVLRDNLSVFNKRRHLPWVDGLQEILASEMPGLRLTDAFPQSMVEITNVLNLQRHHDHYLDLSGVLAAVREQCGPLFEQAFAPCRAGAKVVGVPIIASPRFLCFNPAVLQRHGCALPRAGWTWDEFMATVRRLAQVMEPALVLDWVGLPFYWLNIVRRAGGQLFDATAADPIAVDRPATIRGLHLFRELSDALGRPAHDQETFSDAFARGEAAMAIGTRQFTAALRLRGWDGWAAVPLPLIPGGCDTTSQAGDLACVHNTCTDPEFAKRFIALMLSSAVQSYLGGLRYGVPVRQHDAMASLDLADPREVLVLTEMGRMSCEPCLPSAEVARLVIDGVTRILDVSDDIARDVHELARAARLLLAVQGHRPHSLAPAPRS